MARSIQTIARDITKDWPKVNYAAEPYLNAMHSIDNITDQYYQDSAPSIVRYFLSNATSWRGPVARAIKAELKALLAA